MPSFSDSIFLFVLALLLFGPKKLPVLAREIGKWVGEFRRASNEFKMQMDEELRQVEQADRIKKIEAIEAAAPPPPALTVPPLPGPAVETTPETTPETTAAETSVGISSEEPAADASTGRSSTRPDVVPIAEAGELKIMPPSTGLPTRRSNPLGSLVDAIPSADAPAAPAAPVTPDTNAETVHGN